MAPECWLPSESTLMTVAPVLIPDKQAGTEFRVAPRAVIHLILTTHL